VAVSDGQKKSRSAQTADITEALLWGTLIDA
jgi:hypothetical protein